MKHNELFISKFTAWAPCIETTDDWEEWAQGKRELICSKESPGIKFTDSMFRRRISQISKMTIQVVHDLLPVKEDTKMLFMSFRGEIARQFSINKTEIEEGNISPAAFSLSTFNAPIALTSMALQLKGGYTAIYPSNNSIKAGLVSAAAMLNTEPADELIVVYADENIPEEYSSLVSEPSPPIAFSLLLTNDKQQGSVSYLIKEDEITPKEFLRQVILQD